MKKSRAFCPSGQANVEYALLIALVAVNVIAASIMLAPGIKAVYQKLPFGGAPAASPVPNDAPAAEKELSPIAATANDFMERMKAYRAKNGKWPRGSESARFKNLGLNPNDWKKAVNGIYWRPAGDRIALENRKKDDLQVYVTDLNGKKRHLYDGWKIWCMAESGTCYFHTVAPGNEVDVNTVEVVQQKPKKKK